MSESTPEERTELPTDRRMGKLRNEGAIFQSNEINQVISLFIGFYVLTLTVPYFFEQFKKVFKSIFISINNPEPLQLENLYAGLLSVLMNFAPLVFVIAAVIAVFVGFSVMLQTKWNVKEKWIKFDFAMLNPITGVKRIFSIQGFVNTGKAIAKLVFILPIAYLALKHEAPKMIQLMHTNLWSLLNFVAAEMQEIFWKIMYVLIAISIFDYVWGKFQWFKNNKMTKPEVKDERKSIEGDETTKRRIIAKGLQRIAQRLSQSVPKADVIITNPTHYAVALKYDRGSMKAPTVVAKGKGFMALKIREIAKEAGVPILERKPLARALFASVEVGREIPYELYKAVAEVLAYVFRLKNPHLAQAQAKRQQQINL
jgi:flagellar biosynthetic protein FlhB